MNFIINKVNILVTVPKDYIDKVRNAACECGAGIIGNYSYCTLMTKSVGTFIPNDNANPFIGKKDNLELVDETTLEFICDIKKVKKILKVIKENHPYEEPVINIIPLLDEENFK